MGRPVCIHIDVPYNHLLEASIPSLRAPITKRSLCSQPPPGTWIRYFVKSKVQDPSLEGSLDRSEKAKAQDHGGGTLGF